MTNQTDRDMKFQIGGWILFIVCALFFLASSLKNQDILTMVGSIVFLVACIVFLIPLLTAINKNRS